MNLVTVMKSVQDRLESRTVYDHRSGCLIFTGNKNHKGYGSIRDHGNKSTHRVSYKLFVGTIPEGLHCLHKCDEPACVAPWHLYLGTNKDNMKQRGERRRVAIGLDNGKCKLSNEEVLAIRNDPRKNHSAVARDFGISAFYALQIRTGQRRQGSLSTGIK